MENRDQSNSGLSAYSIVKINEENLSDLINLFKIVAKKTYSIDYLKKKYASPRSSGAYNGYLAYDKKTGQIVSVSSSLPLYIKTSQNHIIPATQMMETFTLETHRGKGLMTILTQKIIADEMANGVMIFYGLLNQNNIHGFTKKLNFQVQGSMNYCTIKIQTFPLEAICRNLGMSKLYRWYAERKIKPYRLQSGQYFENSVISEGGSGILHDQDFYKYKTFTFNAIIHIQGISTWIKLETGLLVGDVSLPEKISQQDFRDWLDALKKLAKNLGLHQIIFQLHPESRLAKMLGKEEQLHQSWSITTLLANEDFAFINKDLKFTYADFETF